MPAEVTVLPGPALLSGIEHGPSLAVHRQQYGAPPLLDRSALLADLHRIGLRGRGGAGFPFATKVEALGRGRPVLVVNLSEGEPASSKDTALALTRPHLVLDGVVVAARALAAREVHVVLPGERPMAAAAMRTALAERDDPVRILTGRPSRGSSPARPRRSSSSWPAGRTCHGRAGPPRRSRVTRVGRRCSATARHGPGSACWRSAVPATTPGSAPAPSRGPRC